MKWREGISICLVNVLGPALWFSQIFAFTPVSYKPATATTPATFTWSIWSTVFWLFIAGIFGASIVLKIIYWPEAHEIENSIRILFIIEFINQISSFMISIAYYTQAQARANALNEMSIMFYDPPQGITRALSNEREKKAAKLCTIEVIAVEVILLSLFSAVLLIYFIGDAEKYYKNPFLYFMDQLVSSFNITTFIFCAFDCGLFANIIIGMLNSVLDTIKTVFKETNARTFSNKNHQHPGDAIVIENYEASPLSVRSNTIHVCDQISNVRSTYGTIMDLKSKINDCLNPQIAIATSLTLIIVVLNCYLLFVILSSGRFNTLALLSFAKVLITLLGVVIQISVADDLHRMVSVLF